MSKSDCDLAIRATWLIVLPVALIGLGAWGLHAWLQPAPRPPAVVDAPLITTRGVVVQDNEGRERIVLRAAADVAEISVETADGSGRVVVTARGDQVQIAAGKGSQWFRITPDGTESYNVKGPK